MKSSALETIHRPGMVANGNNGSINLTICTLSKFDLKGFAESDLSPQCIDDPPLWKAVVNKAGRALRKIYADSIRHKLSPFNPRHRKLLHMVDNPASMYDYFPSDKDLKHKNKGVKDAFLRFHREKSTVSPHMVFSGSSYVSRVFRYQSRSAAGREGLHSSIRSFAFDRYMGAVFLGFLAVVIFYYGVLLSGLRLAGVAWNVLTSHLFVQCGPCWFYFSLVVYHWHAHHSFEHIDPWILGTAGFLLFWMTYLTKRVLDWYQSQQPGH